MGGLNEIVRFFPNTALNFQRNKKEKNLCVAFLYILTIIALSRDRYPFDSSVRFIRWVRTSAECRASEHSRDI